MVVHTGPRPAHGSLQWLVPEHVCTTVNLYRDALLVDDAALAADRSDDDLAVEAGVDAQRAEGFLEVLDRVRAGPEDIETGLASRPQRALGQLDPVLEAPVLGSTSADRVFAKLERRRRIRIRVLEGAAQGARIVGGEVRYERRSDT